MGGRKEWEFFEKRDMEKRTKRHRKSTGMIISRQVRKNDMLQNRCSPVQRDLGILLFLHRFLIFASCDGSYYVIYN